MTFSAEVITLFSVALTALGLAIFIYVKNKKSIINQSFSVFLFGITIIVLGFIFLFTQRPFMVFDRLIHYGGLILLFGLLVFSQVFPAGKTFPRSKFLYLPFILTGTAIPFNLLIENASFDAGGNIVPENGPLFLPYILFWAAYVIVPFFFLIKNYRKAQNREKVQMQYLFLGLAILLTSFLIFNLILPLLGITYLFFASVIASIAMLWLTSCAIIRHNLLDIRIVIQRGLIYLALLIIILSIYFFGLQLLGYILHKMTDIAIMISAGITTILGVFFIRPLEDYFQKITDHIFFKDKYNYPEALHQLSKILHTSITQTDIINNSSTLLKAIFKTRQVQFQIAEKDSEIESKNWAAISIPIVFEEKLIGSLDLGSKLSGDSYAAEDKKLLETFTCQASVALEKGRLYEQVQEYSTHLEQLVEKRTAEIKELQENQKQTMIDISHNLQTPLAVINGELELLRDSSADQEKVSSVKKSINKVSQFIRQLLHLAKLNHSAYNIELEPMNLSTVIENQVEYFETMSDEKNVKIASSIPKRIMILGNRRLIEELLTNLVVNAITYRRIDIESMVNIVLKKTESGVSLIVEDNGQGIPKKDISGLFNRFYSGSQKSNINSTGLGLAICKKIVEKHNGKISVESILGEKTIFTIIFPEVD